MISIYVILTILFMHWVADFKCQTEWMANNKSTNNTALGAHVLVYTSFLLAFGLAIIGDPKNALLWAMINGGLHFTTDYITSRLTGKRWKEANYRSFFNTIGFDQFIHFATLFVTLKLFI
jgi:hypothetical protein